MTNPVKGVLELIHISEKRPLGAPEWLRPTAVKLAEVAGELYYGVRLLNDGRDMALTYTVALRSDEVQSEKLLADPNAFVQIVKQLGNPEDRRDAALALLKLAAVVRTGMDTKSLSKARSDDGNDRLVNRVDLTAEHLPWGESDEPGGVVVENEKYRVYFAVQTNDGHDHIHAVYLAALLLELLSEANAEELTEGVTGSGKTDEVVPVPGAVS